jgi:cell division initiation protein
MSERPEQPPTTADTTVPAQPADRPQRTERPMRVTPLDMRQPHFRSAMRGFDKTDVVSFLAEASNDYEHSLRENDRLRSEIVRVESMLQEHRDRETNLRNTLLTAQRLADEVKEAAQSEAKIIVREAQGRADLLLQKAQARLEEIERDINELKLRRRDAEGQLEGAIQALYRALEFIRDQDQNRADDNLLLHRPRQADAPAAAARPADVRLDDRKASL